MQHFEELVQIGISRTITEALAANYGPTLLPLQQQVIEQTGLLSRGESLLVSAPTASGKTLLAELAALKHISLSRLALYLVPTRALAEQKAAEFASRLGPLGIRVACSTRDRREQDKAILKGQVHLTVAVYEKAIGLLARQASLLARMGVVIADEIQLLGDPERGASIDLFLTRWKTSADRPQLLALSAVLGNPEELAAWLRVPLFRSEIRPVPLREGVLDLLTGQYRWRERSTGAIGNEQLLDQSPDTNGAEHDAPIEALNHLARNHSPLIFFCATRGDAVAAAFALAERRIFPAAHPALNDLAACEPELSRERLEALMPHGIGLHTADMPALHRTIVEQAFQRGELPILVATPTLEQGVNLMASTIVHSPVMIRSQQGGFLPAKVPLSRARLLNQGGRAGRTGTATGRSIIFARSSFEADQAWSSFIAAPLEAVRSPLLGAGLPATLASSVKSCNLLTAEALEDFLNATLAARTAEPGTVSKTLQKQIQSGVDWHLWDTARGRIELTGLGELVAQTGILPETAHRWARFLEGCADSPTPAAALFLVMLAEEWTAFPLGVPPGERRHNHWPFGIQERLGRSNDLARRLSAHLDRAGGAPYVCHKAARRALLLDDWLGGQSIAELELTHRLPSGQMGRLAATTVWLVGAAAELAGILRLPRPAIDAFEELGRRVNALERRLAGRPDKEPAADSPAAAVLAPVMAPVPETTSRDALPPAAVENSPSVRLRFPANNPGAIEFDGEVIHLTPIQYQLLRLLARDAGRAVSYREIHETIWKDAVVEQQMIPYHRGRIEKSLGLTTGALVGTRARWGLYLKLEPEQVTIGDTEEPTARLEKSG